MLISSAQNPMNEMYTHIRHGIVSSKFSTTPCYIYILIINILYFTPVFTFFELQENK